MDDLRQTLLTKLLSDGLGVICQIRSHFQRGFYYRMIRKANAHPFHVGFESLKIIGGETISVDYSAPIVWSVPVKKVLNIATFMDFFYVSQASSLLYSVMPIFIYVVGSQM